MYPSKVNVEGLTFNFRHLTFYHARYSLLSLLLALPQRREWRVQIDITTQPHFMNSVVTSRAPGTPNGCPMAIAPH